MNLKDCRGLAVSTTDRTALQMYETALEHFNGWYVDFAEPLEAALAADPAFTMAHCLRGALYATANEAAVVPEVERSLRAAEASASSANDRERLHMAALRAWLARDMERVAQTYARITREYPRDLLALQVGQQADFMIGDGRMLRDRIAQVLPHWDASVPGHGFVLGMYAFGLEQNNHYAQAEEAGRAALALNRRDPWAIHAVAHVMEMQGRVDAGVQWLESRRADWSERNALAYHNAWHLALYYLDRGDVAQVLRLYDEYVRPNPTPTAMEMVDASAMLWRLQLRGIEVGGRWRPVAEAWSALGADAFLPFSDVHAAMAFAGAGDEAALGRLLALLEAHEPAGGRSEVEALEVGRALCRAVADFGAGRYADAAQRLLATRSRAQRCGGSVAQRDIFELTLLEAALRAGNAPLARALAAERMALRPTGGANRALMRRAAAAGRPAVADGGRAVAAA